MIGKPTYLGSGKTAMNLNVLNRLFDFIKDKRCEGYATYLYLDRNGVLHTGVGFNLEMNSTEIYGFKCSKKGSTKVTRKLIDDAVKTIRALAREKYP